MINKRFDERYNIFNGVKNVSSEIFQIYPVFIPAKKFIKYFSVPTWIDSWKSNEISEENIENITKSDSNFAQTFVDPHALFIYFIYFIFNLFIVDKFYFIVQSD